MSKVDIHSGWATYPFNEALDRIFKCEDREELEILAMVITDEKKQYALYYLMLIQTAFEIKRREFNQRHM